MATLNGKEIKFENCGSGVFRKIDTGFNPREGDDLVTPDILKKLEEEGEYKPQNPWKIYLDYLSTATTVAKLGITAGLGALIFKMNGIDINTMRNFFKDERGVSYLSQDEKHVKNRIVDILKEKYRVSDEALNRDYTKLPIKPINTEISPLTEKESKRKISNEEINKIFEILSYILRDNKKELSDNEIDKAVEEILAFLLRKDKKELGKDVCPGLEILNPKIPECIDGLKKTGVE